VTVVSPATDMAHTAAAIERLGDLAGPINLTASDYLLGTKREYGSLHCCRDR